MCFQLAKAGSRCDYALYVGAASDNAAILPSIASQAVGLKMYLNDTFSTLKMDNVSLWMEVGQENSAFSVVVRAVNQYYSVPQSPLLFIFATAVNY